MENNIKLAFTGDILSYACQNKAIKRKYGTYDYTTVFQEVAPLLEQADYAIGSLETPIAGQAAGYTADPIVFNTPESILDALRKCGFDMLTTANNHCLDRGIGGLRSTIEALDRHGFDHTGTQLDKQTPKFHVKDFGGVKIAFVAYSYGTNYTAHGHFLDVDHKHMVNLFQPHPPRFYRPWYKQLLLDCFKRYAPLSLQMKVRPPYPTTKYDDCGTLQDLECAEMEGLRQTIKQAKAEAQKVITLLHIGGQFNLIPGEYSRAVVEACAEAGANAVICNHSHTILPIERIGQTVVAHCLGNFSFTPGDGYYYDDVQADYSALLYLDISKETLEITPSFTLLKNVIDNDGISRVKETSQLYQLSPTNELVKDIRLILHRAKISSNEVKQLYVLK